jgi:ribosomal protein S18 acetylase RimI-like enzyme
MGNSYIYPDEYEQIEGPDHFSDEIDSSLSGIINQWQTGRISSEPPVRLRNAVISDSRFIGRLSRDVFAIYGPYDDILARWFRSGDDITTIIACLDKIQIGFAMLSDPSERYNLQDVSELLGIAVEPERQGKGIGGMLLRAIESKSASLSIKWLFLHTAVANVPARRLYEMAGYRNLEIERNFYPEGQDAIVMYKAVEHRRKDKG